MVPNEGFGVKESNKGVEGCGPVQFAPHCTGQGVRNEKSQKIGVRSVESQTPS
jgi:hypothetical protein